MIIVPLQSDPAHAFRTPLDGVLFAFRVRWLPGPAIWTIDLDIDTLEVHIHGLALVTGRNLLHGHGVWQLGSLTLVDLQGNEDPDFDGLGDRWQLVYLSRGEVVE